MIRLHWMNDQNEPIGELDIAEGDRGVRGIPLGAVMVWAEVLERPDGYVGKHRAGRSLDQGVTAR